jgi:mannobiose 2-epimerase
VTNDGTPLASNTAKTSLSQSRDAYAFARAYMVSGDKTYLEYGRHTLDFLYNHLWDKENGGFHTIASREGRNIDLDGGRYDHVREKWSFMQFYALLGIGAYWDAAHESADMDMLVKARGLYDEKLWDKRAGLEGYYETANYDWSNPREKGFTPTVDCITTHGLSLFLLTGNDQYKKRLLALGDAITGRFIPAMAGRKLGFPEFYTSDWQPASNSFQFIGHVLKSAWCLGRIYLVEPKPEYLAGAERLAQEILDKGWDVKAGAPFTHADNTAGVITNRNKDYWTVEQAINCGLVLYHITGKAKYLKMADDAIRFFTTYIYDYKYGDVYAEVNEDGTPLSRLPMKGDYYKAGYHNMETLYSIYLYGNLYVHKKPVTLHYTFPAAALARSIKLTPTDVEDKKLVITGVTANGKKYENFDSASRVLKLPAGTEGEFIVTFELK